MKRNKLLIFTRILYVLFAITTIISLIIVYNHINSSFAVKFLIGYMFFTFFLLLYIPIITVLNSRKLKWTEIKKRIFKFITLFVFFGVSTYILDYIFRPSKVDLFRTISTSMALAFGISFIDVIFLKNKDK